LGQDVLRYSDYKNNYVNRENSTLKILFFGIVSKYKGINDLLTAAELLYDRKVDFLLTIAGMKVDFEFSIDEKLRNNVKHIDRFVQESEIPSLFSNCDIVVQPYIEVSQSGVAPLSFGFGKPVIVTNIGSFTEIVEDGYNGFLVSPNSPYEIADKLEYLFRNKDVLNNLGKSAKLTYENKISWNKNIDKYINIYKRVGKSSR
jgi:glycosyltransferase involved in cell wall biosynthesis